MQHSEYNKAACRNDHAYPGIPADTVVAQRMRARVSGKYQADREQRKEQSGAARNPEFLLPIDGDVCRNYAVRRSPSSGV